jgi:hypothetical protein
LRPFVITPWWGVPEIPWTREWVARSRFTLTVAARGTHFLLRARWVFAILEWMTPVDNAGLAPREVHRG